MASLRKIIAALDELLDPSAFEDYCPNGLQVAGREEVGRVATGVSASVELFELAAGARADLVLVHHGILWGNAPQVIGGALKARLALLFDSGMALAAYHLPLDAHPRLGNNVLLADGLGCRDPRPFGEHRGRAVGCRASWPNGGISIDELVARVHSLTARPPLVFASGPERVASIGIVSGAGSEWLDEAVAEGLDAFLTGEPAERVMAQAREAGIHFIAAGHYATETLGVRALGDLLGERFGIEHRFIDVPNPI